MEAKVKMGDEDRGWWRSEGAILWQRPTLMSHQLQCQLLMVFMADQLKRDKVHNILNSVLVIDLTISSTRSSTMVSEVHCKYRLP